MVLSTTLYVVGLRSSGGDDDLVAKKREEIPSIMSLRVSRGSRLFSAEPTGYHLSGTA